MFIRSLVHCDYNGHAEAYSSFKIKTKYAIKLSFTVTFYYSSVCVCLMVEVEHENHRQEFWQTISVRIDHC